LPATGALVVVARITPTTQKRVWRKCHEILRQAPGNVLRCGFSPRFSWTMILRHFAGVVANRR
jgi:hypothetical protein